LAVPATPEQLMRSRYTAFVRGDVAYLLATWHPSTRPERLALEAGVKWLGLKILRTPPVSEDDEEGFVEFVARYRVGGDRAARLRETSRFVREGGRWYYADGQVVAPT
jgi:SEC-C motif-containing protein